MTAPFDEHRLRRLLEGDGSAASALLRAALFIPGRAYGVAMRLRRRAYEAGIFQSYDAGLPTVSVGNLTAGGSGKTPTVAAIARRLLDAGHRPGILMRGYAKTPGGESDEASLYRTLVPEAVLAVNPDRRAGAAVAKRNGAAILLMDDGFQHRRLRRDLDIVLVDATSPWGGGNTIPGGLLREPLPTFRTADALVVTRSDQVDAPALAAVRSGLTRLAPGVPVFTGRHRPARLRTLAGTNEQPESLSGKDIVILAGIARPEAFARTVTQLGGRPVATFAKSDHHPMNRDFVLAAVREAERRGALTVTTEKDFAKPVFQHLQEETTDNTVGEIRILGVEQEIDDMEELMRLILGTIEK